jgi:hypothetical protein
MGDANSDDGAIADLQARVARIPDELKATIPEGTSLVMSPQILLTRIHKATTILTGSLVPGVAITLFNALQNQPTIAQGVLMAAFTSLLALSLGTLALLRDQRRNIDLVRRLIRDQSSSAYGDTLRAASANADQAIRHAMIDSGELDARVKADLELAESIASLAATSPAPLEDGREAKIAEAKAEIAERLRQSELAERQFATSLHQSVLRCSGHNQILQPAALRGYAEPILALFGLAVYFLWLQKVKPRGNR